MTKVLIDLRRSVSSGVAPTTGLVAFNPTHRREEDGHVVTEAGFDVRLVEGTALVTLEPTGPEWCWRAVEHTPGLDQTYIRYVAVPDSDSVVNYTDLIDVDPATLDPVAEPEAAWWGALTDYREVTTEARG